MTHKSLLRRPRRVFIKKSHGMGVKELREKLASSLFSNRGISMSKKFLKEEKYDAGELYSALRCADTGGWHYIFSQWVKSSQKKVKTQQFSFF